jgi:hypothetical protein
MYRVTFLSSVYTYIFFRGYIQLSKVEEAEANDVYVTFFVVGNELKTSTTTVHVDGVY